MTRKGKMAAARTRADQAGSYGEPLSSVSCLVAYRGPSRRWPASALHTDAGTAFAWGPHPWPEVRVILV